MASTIRVTNVNSVAPGGFFELLVELSSDQATEVLASDLLFRYDPTKLSLLGVEQGALALTSGWATPVTSESTAGQVRTSQFGTSGLVNGSGTLLRLRFEALNTATGLVAVELDQPNSIGLSEGAVAFTAINGNVTIEEAGVAARPIGEYGQVQLNLTTTVDPWVTVSLSNTYNSPIIITGDPSLNDGSPAAVRIQNVTGNSFQIRLQEPYSEDGNHALETIPFIVVEAGEWQLSDGTRISAGKQTGAKLTSAGFDPVAFGSAFASTPTVVTQVQTTNGPDWVVTRTKDISTSGFSLSMQEEEAINNSGHAAEQIGWLAIDQGSSNDGDTAIVANTSSRVFTNNLRSELFGTTFTSAPTLIGKLSSYFGADPANARISSVSQTEFSALIKEDQSRDAEIAHGAEEISSIAIAGISGLLQGNAYTSIIEQGQGTGGTISADGPLEEGVTLSAPRVSGDPNGDTTWDATGADPAYQWLKNGVAIANATANAYTVPLNSIDVAAETASYSVEIIYTDAQGFRNTNAPVTTDAVSVAKANNIVPSGSTIGEYGQAELSLSAATNPWVTVNLTKTYNNPVIIAGDPSLNDGSPVAVRIQNVTGNSFQIRLQEPYSEDGNHALETIPFIVVEAGEWQLSDGTRISAGKQTGAKLTSAGFDPVAFGSAFASTPTVVTQVQTTNGPDWVVTRTKDISTSGFSLSMQEEEAINNSGHAAEQIGWLAIDQGSSNDGDTAIVANTSSRVFTNNLRSELFGTTFTSAPTLIGKLSSYFGADPANARISSVSQTEFSALIKEDQSRDAEIAHGAEEISSIALEGSSGLLEGASYLQSNIVDFAELGNAVINSNWQAISFTKSYVNPVIVISDPSFNGADPATVRVRNLSSTGVEIRIQEPNYKDGAHGNEQVSWMVMEAGSYELSDGTRIAAGSYKSSLLSTAGFETIDLSQYGFSGTTSPVLLTQVETFQGSDWVTTRVKKDPLNPLAIQVSMQEEERNNSGAHAQETIGWIAVNPGRTGDGDTIIEAGITPNRFTNQAATQSFGGAFASMPGLIGKLGSFNGADPANIRFRQIGTSGFTALVTEEQSFDTEVAHTSEKVDYFAFDQANKILSGIKLDIINAV